MTFVGRVALTLVRVTKTSRSNMRVALKLKRVTKTSRILLSRHHTLRFASIFITTRKMSAAGQRRYLAMRVYGFAETMSGTLPLFSSEPSPQRWWLARRSNTTHTNTREQNLRRCTYIYIHTHAHI